MRLQCVTLTGADDSVTPEQIVGLSDEFPLIEWAILFSQSKSDEPRYPSVQWVDRLLEIADERLGEKRPLKLAAHLCGKWVKEALEGRLFFLNDERRYRLFGRVQFNLAKGALIGAVKNETFLETLRRCHKSNGMTRPDFILGGDWSVVPGIDGEFFNKYPVCPLFDASGGRGIGAKEWPGPYDYIGSFGRRVPHGYAGGIGPDNVAEMLDSVEASASHGGGFCDYPVWIDMESKIRTDDKFDLAKCEAVMSAVHQWFEDK